MTEKYICRSCGLEKERGFRHLHKRSRSLQCYSCRILQVRANIAGTNTKAVLYKFKEQDGKCALCDKILSLIGNKCHIDHDHVTGRFRGLLCVGCNMVLRIQYQNKAWFVKTMQYLGIE